MPRAVIGAYKSAVAERVGDRRHGPPNSPSQKYLTSFARIQPAGLRLTGNELRITKRLYDCGQTNYAFKPPTFIQYDFVIC